MLLPMGPLPSSPLIPRDYSHPLPLQGSWQPKPSKWASEEGLRTSHLLREPGVSQQCSQVSSLQSGHIGSLINPRESLSFAMGGGNHISASRAVLEQSALYTQKDHVRMSMSSEVGGQDVTTTALS